MSTLMDSVRRVNRTGRVEDSVRLRVATLVAVLVAVVGIGIADAAPTQDAVLAFLLLPVGAWISWRRADQDNFALKGLLALGAVLALVRFFGDMQDVISVEFARIPLASLFLGVQVLHGFDLPARRDLGFTLVSSITLIALTATTTYEGWFLFLLMIYAVVAVVAMVEMQRSAARQRADDLAEEDDLVRLRSAEDDLATASSGTDDVDWLAALRRTEGGDLRRTAKAAMGVVLLGALVFALVPRGGASQLAGLEFRQLPSSIPLPSGLVKNDGLPGDGQTEPVEGEIPLDYNPTSYFGFAQNVDLRSVGTPDDIDVLRVRAERPRFWRGMVFDTYTGIGWTRDDRVPDAVQGSPVELFVPTNRDAEYETVVQTYELLADTPNLVFAAASAQEVWLGGASVNPWNDGTLSTGQTMDAGTIYSVISKIDVTPPNRLRQSDGAIPPGILERWTQLPDTVPQRVHDLAFELTRSVVTPYAKAEAVQAWIGANTEYTLDAPPPPLTGDVVDHFLFESRQGWCEPIASSMVVLLRSAGIPARFSTGFQPGRRNPITGSFDVKMENAHAWVEVWIPGHSWIEFDPTGAVPLAVAADAGLSIPLVDILTWVRDTLVPEPVKAALAAVGRRALDQWPLTLVLLAAVVTSVVALRRARRAAALALRAPWERLELALADEGLHREAGQTPRAFHEAVRRRRPDLAGDDLATLLAAEEAARYGAPPAEAHEVEAALDRLADSVRQRGAGAT